jgi:hypothetical protein
MLWRTLAGGVLGAALAVAVCVSPVTVLEASLAGGALPVAGFIVGGVLDVRADGRRNAAKGRRR